MRRMLAAASALFFLAAAGASGQGAILASDYGVSATASSATNVAGLNAATAACFHLATGTQSGCQLVIPCGLININASLATITYGMRVTGCNQGLFPTQFNDIDIGGTQIQQSCGTCGILSFETIEPVVIEHITFSSPSNATASAAVLIKPTAFPISAPNRGMSVNHVTFLGGYIGLSCVLCGNFDVSFNRFYGQNNTGLDLTNAALADSGDDSIIGNTFGSYPGGYTTAASCIYLHTHGGIRIISNKVINCDVGLRVTASQGRTGTLIVSGNSFEEAGTNNIRIEQGAAGKTYGNIQIFGNEFSNLTSATFQGSIAVVAGSANYLDYVMISDNLIVNGYDGSPAFATASCMQIQDGNEVMIQHNLCSMGGKSSWNGIAINSHATNVSVLDNRVIGAPGGDYQFAVPVSWRARPGSPVAFGALPSNVAAGSQAFVSNSTAGGACNGAGGGAMGFFQNGAWRCP